MSASSHSLSFPALLAKLRSLLPSDKHAELDAVSKSINSAPSDKAAVRSSVVAARHLPHDLATGRPPLRPPPDRMCQVQRRLCEIAGKELVQAAAHQHAHTASRELPPPFSPPPPPGAPQGTCPMRRAASCALYAPVARGGGTDGAGQRVRSSGAPRPQQPVQQPVHEGCTLRHRRRGGPRGAPPMADPARGRAAACTAPCSPRAQVLELLGQQDGNPPELLANLPADLGTA